MTSSKQTEKSQLPLWILVALLGLGGVGLFVFGLTRPEPVRNLADPMPIANLGPEKKPSYAREPSARRKIARAKNEEKKTECQWRHDDCSIACSQYAKTSPAFAECMGFCDRARSSCNTWAHQ